MQPEQLILLILGRNELDKKTDVTNTAAFPIRDPIRSSYGESFAERQLLIVPRG